MPVSCLFSGVELASCQFHAYFRAWNWHLASFMLIFGCGTGILPVSCLFSGVEMASCQFHAYFRAGRMPTLLLLIPRLTQRRKISLFNRCDPWRI
ncbi:MAG: hypothetical protein F6K55_40640 [Moorea sp. SIO4A3]|nr:hypothetical protein [Moorena sp. SIO4A3]